MQQGPTGRPPGLFPAQHAPTSLADALEGVSGTTETLCGYSANEGRMLTLAILEDKFSNPGTEVAFVWGETSGGSSKPAVERHV
jgi:hypothetical protein